MRHPGRRPGHAARRDHRRHARSRSLDIGGRPFLAWLMRELLRFGIDEFLLLTGHLSAAVEQAVRDAADRLPQHVPRCASRPSRRPPAPAALFSMPRDLLAERFLLCNGDSLFDCNLARPAARRRRRYRCNHRAHAAAARSDDASRYGVVALDQRPGRRVPRTAGHRDMPGIINAGIYAFDRQRAGIMSRRPARWNGTCCPGWRRQAGWAGRWPMAGSSISAFPRIWPAPARPAAPAAPPGAVPGPRRRAERGSRPCRHARPLGLDSGRSARDPAGNRGRLARLRRHQPVGRGAWAL